MGGQPPVKMPTRRPRGTGASAVKRFAVTVLILIPVGLLLFFGWTRMSDGLSELGLLGEPVHVPGDDGGTVYYLTGQWKTIFSTPTRTSYSRTIRTDLYVDLWAVHAATATPRWRKRITREPQGAMDYRKILGADGDTLWLLLKGHVAAVSAASGTPLLKVGELEARNPPLQGILPVEERFFSFDSHGLRFTGLDGRAWRVDAAFNARIEETAPEGQGTASPPAYYAPYASYMFQVRSLDIPGWWLGLLNDDEARSFDENNVIGGLDIEGRHRLWRAKAGKDENFFGEMTVYNEFAPLPGSPEFLGGGLLRSYQVGTQLPALWLPEPDSVLVLHREKLGDLGRLKLTRVAGPEGNVLWDTVLPMTILQSVMPSAKCIAFFGKENFPPPPGSPPVDPTRDAPERLVCIDLATGAVQIFDHSNIESHPLPETIEIGA